MGKNWCMTHIEMIIEGIQGSGGVNVRSVIAGGAEVVPSR
jgi:hypothetical protein